MPAVNEAGEALWPEQFSRQWMDEKKASYAASGYPWMWEALYQGNPPTVLDAEFDPSLFSESVMFDQWPSPDDTRFRVIALDPSMGKSNKSDYSSFAIMYLANNGTIYVDVDMDRRDPWTITEAACRLCKQHQPHRIVHRIERVSGSPGRDARGTQQEKRPDAADHHIQFATRTRKSASAATSARICIGANFDSSAKAAGWRCAWINSALSPMANSTTARIRSRWV